MENTFSDERLLIEALRRGEEVAFRRLVDLHQERVLNTCLGFVPIRQDAEDLTQEVFIEVFRSVSGFREASSLATWMYRIAVRKSLEKLRHAKRKKRFAFIRSLTGADDDLAAGFDHPGILMENRERAAILFDKIGRLPENQRTAFLLHKVEGLPHAEIGAVMKLNVPAVEALIHRAKKNLRSMLEEYYRKHD